MSIVRGRRGARCRKRSGANNAKSKIRSRVEHVFAEQKDPDGFVHPDHRDRESEDEDRTGDLVYNIKRLLFLRRRGGMIDDYVIDCVTSTAVPLSAAICAGVAPACRPGLLN